MILVTKDIVIRIKAQMLGIEAEDFTTEQAPVSEMQYTGRNEVFVPEDLFSDFKKKGIPLPPSTGRDRTENVFPSPWCTTSSWC